MLEEFDKKNILILGLAREGIDTLNFLFKLYPKRSFGVSDQLSLDKLDINARKLIKKRQSQLVLFLGDKYLHSINKYDTVIKSPGIPLANIARFLKPKQTVTSQMKIFFDHCPGKIIGITGTKGKSTTTSLIYAILKEGGVRVRILGNIGKPVLSSLLTATPNDTYVCELSCHQLSDIKKSPHIAIFLNIFPEHLDYYGTYEKYQKAKTNICRYQNKNDHLIYNPANLIVKRLIKYSSATKIPISPQNVNKFTNQNDIPLKGIFNLYNIDAAIKVGELCGVNPTAIKKAIKNFKPLPHRLEFVGKYKGIDFYNDSLATVPEATISAIDVFDPKIGTLITGGFDRGVSYNALAKRIIDSQIKNIAFFSTTGKIIWDQIRKLNHKHQKFNILFTDSMKEAVSFGYQNTETKTICLMSCASASFNLFKDYQARGNAFKKYVKKITSS
ncbi:MAG: UDP-N-acetylmuramoyl-L-alanine--D-glutamate ligase [bacterium]